MQCNKSVYCTKKGYYKTGSLFALAATIFKPDEYAFFKIVNQSIDRLPAHDPRLMPAA